MVSAVSDADRVERLLDAWSRVLDETLDALAGIVEDLGDDGVNAVPDVPGINSVFALVTHLNGVMGFWGESVIGGGDVPRDRDAEFRATGTADEALGVIAALRDGWPRWWRLGLEVGVADAAKAGRGRRDPAGTTAEWVAAHVLRDLTQHLGHAEITRDVLRAHPGITRP